jgi:hypothetical protein
MKMRQSKPTEKSHEDTEAIQTLWWMSTLLVKGGDSELSMHDIFRNDKNTS